MEERISSRKNPLLQQVRRLLTSRKDREKTGLFVADGTKLLGEAVRWWPGLDTVVLSDGVEAEIPAGVRVVRVPEDVMASISPMKAPQGALFLCRMPEMGQVELSGARYLVLDGLQDPGNVGTIWRTADALGADGLLLVNGCADPWNHKTVRATMGAVFRSRPQWASHEAVAETCKAQGVPLCVTALSDRAVDVRQADLKKAALVIGSEGKGVGEYLLSRADKELIIPMSERCESLNAAIAAAIVLWEMKR